MRTFLRNLAIALLLLPVGWTAGLVVAHHTLPEDARANLRWVRRGAGHLFTRLREAEGSGPVDVVVVGSSHAYRGFDPRLFAARGMRLFNLGSSNQTPVQGRYLLGRYLDRLQPRLVLVEVYPLGLYRDGREATVDLVSNATPNLGLARVALTRWHLPTLNSFLLGVGLHGLGLADDTPEPVRRRSDRYVAGGFVQKRRKAVRPEPEEPLQVVLRPEQVDALRGMVADTKARGIRVALVQAPVSTHRYRAMTGKEEADALFRSLEPDAYLNYNEGLEMDPRRHFYDPHHLTQAGVRRFNRRLVEDLLASGLLGG